jgi:hypothetical protein
MKDRIVPALALAAALSGCSLTLPVEGLVESTGETFSGKATGYIDGGGTLNIAGSNGVQCWGNFVYVTKREGEGVFRCSDGRSGPFRFVSTGTRGTGQGDLGGRRFTFTFG